MLIDERREIQGLVKYLTECSNIQENKITVGGCTPQVTLPHYRDYYHYKERTNIRCVRVW